MQAARALELTTGPNSASPPPLRLVTPVFEEALARLEYLVASRRQLGLVLGQAGCGKSTLARQFLLETRRRFGDGAAIHVLGMDSREFLWTLAGQLGVRCAGRGSRFGLWQLVANRMAESRYEQRSVTLLLDDMHLAAPDVVDTTLRLVNLASHENVPLTTILFARIQDEKPLDQRLRELVELRVELEPWQPDETAAYVRLRMEQQGLSPADVDPTAVSQCHELTSGAPRAVSQLAHLAAVAQQDAERPADADHVTAVFNELSGQSPHVPLRAS